MTYYGRVRLMVNLLALLRQATSLRRIVTVCAGTKEGQVHTGDFQARHLPVLGLRGHVSALTTLSLEALAEKAPDVSFVRDFPGMVKTNLGKDSKALMIAVIRVVTSMLAPFVALSFDEAGERQVFFSTSARYPAARVKDGGGGMPLPEGVAVARGSDGKTGSGVYSINIDGESAPAKVEQLLAKMREGGMVQKIWSHTEAEFVRITGTASV